ncbi:MAG: hypothetical protein LBR17_04645 [Bacteroidales bacterium]|jgi:hypothetical protein|nr:hypothetical protein [Bacteroidales bacterium]
MKTQIQKGLFIAIVAMLVVGVFFVSCEDDKLDIEYYDTYIDGYITDYHTDEPITDVLFDITCADYNEVGGMGYSGGGSSGFYEIPDVAHTNSQGYYRIQLPKTINGDVMKITNIFPKNNNPNYCFDYAGKRIDYDWYDVKHQSYRIDVRAMPNGYLKVIVPLELNYYLSSYGSSSFEFPILRWKELLYERAFSTYKETLYKVPATNGALAYDDDNGVYNRIEFIVLRKDTLVIDLTNNK